MKLMEVKVKGVAHSCLPYMGDSYALLDYILGISIAVGVLVSKGSNMIGLEMSFHKKSLRKQMSLQVSYRVPGTHRITDKKHGGKIPSADPVGPSRSPMAWPSRPLRQVLF